MKKNALLVGGLAAAGLVGYTYYRKFEMFRDSLSFSIKRVTLLLNQTNTTQISFKAELHITNPRNFSMQAQGMLLIMGYGNKAIASITRQEPFTIEAQKTTVIQIIVSVPFTSSISAVVEMFKNFFANLSLRLNAAGVIRFGLFDAKFSTNINLIN